MTFNCGPMDMAVEHLEYTIDAQNKAIASGCFASKYATAAEIPQSGAIWTATDSPQAALAGTGFSADGYFYDALGNQFEPQEKPTPEIYGAEGIEDSQAFINSTATGTRSVLLTEALEYRIGATVAMPELHLHSDCKKAIVNGFAGTGFYISGDVSLTGNILFQGFEGPNREFQGTLHDVSVVTIVPGSQVDLICVDRNVCFERCRNGLRWVQSFADDYLIDQEGSLKRGYFDASSHLMGQGALLIRIGKIGSWHTQTGCHTQTIGDGREVCPLQVYTDGLGFENPLYQEHHCITFSGTHIDTVINRTTTGDSTPGNNFEACGIRTSGYECHVHNNIIKNVTGTQYDCEGIYAKAARSQIHHNILTNSGSFEGAINAKGTDQNAFGTNPEGDYTSVKDNHVFFDEYSHNNNGTIVNMERVGINLDVPHASTMNGNKVVGANRFCYQISGIPNSDNAGCFCHQNESHEAKGWTMFFVRAAIDTLHIRESMIINPQPADRNFYAIHVPPFTTRGNQHRNYDFSEGTIKMDNQSIGPGQSVALLRLDGGAKDFECVRIDDWNFDVKSTGIIRPVMLMSNAASDNGIDFQMKDWKFHNKLDQPPIYSQNFRFKSMCVELKYRWAVNDSAIRPFFDLGMDDRTSADMDITACFVRNTGGFTQRVNASGLYQANGGSVNVLPGSTSITSQGNDPGVNAGIGTISDRLQAFYSGINGVNHCMTAEVDLKTFHSDIQS